ncbi:MAG: SBBP repeat-containing protein [Bacteroidota bacterium]
MKYLNLIALWSLLFFANPLAAQIPTLAWAHQVGDPYYESYGRGITSDAAGNVYTIGYWQGTADFDPGPGSQNATTTYGDDMFIQKLDAGGNLIWALPMVFAAGGMHPGGIQTDASGNVYIAGRFFGTGDFDPGPGTHSMTATSYDGFVLKLNSAGNFVWAAQIAGNDRVNVEDIAVSPAGEVHLAGTFEGLADFDPSFPAFTLLSYGDEDVFVMKLNTAGVFQWARQAGSWQEDDAFTIALDATGNVYVGGQFRINGNFSTNATPHIVNSSGNFDGFIWKLDANGNRIWARGIGGTSFDRLTGLDVDSNGNVFAVGRFTYIADFDPGPGTHLISSMAGGFSGFSVDGYTLKLNAAGDFQWVQTVASPQYNYGYGVKIDDNNDIYTCFLIAGTSDMDPGPGTLFLTGHGMALQKLDNSGTLEWATIIGTGVGGFGTPDFFDIGNDGSIYIAGHFGGLVDFAPEAPVYNLYGAYYDGTAFFAKLNGNTVTPVEWLGFTAEARPDRTVVLDWETASETDNDHFDVERSRDGKTWNSLVQVQGSGTTGSGHTYTAVDPVPHSGLNYYRIKQVDTDGAFSYTEVRRVLVDEPAVARLVAFPNPVSSGQSMAVAGPAEALEGLRIFDMAGREITAQLNIRRVSSERVELDFGGISSGTYLLRAGHLTQRVLLR